MSFIILNFVIKVNIKYYPETLLEEWNNEIKNNSSDEADNESDNESNDDGVNDQFEK